MADETLYCVVLPSGRIAKLAEPNLERTWEVTEQAGSRVGNSTNAARVNIEVERETVRVHLRAITRGPVPWKITERGAVDLEALAAELTKLVQADGPAAELPGQAKKLLAVLDAPPVDVDFDAMVAAAREGAGGGFVDLNYQTLVKAGPHSLASLFNRYPADFRSLMAHVAALAAGPIDPKAPPAASAASPPCLHCCWCWWM